MPKWKTSEEIGLCFKIAADEFLSHIKTEKGGATALFYFAVKNMIDLFRLQGICTANDFNNFFRDCGLACAVVSDGKCAQEFFGVVGC